MKLTKWISSAMILAGLMAGMVTAQAQNQNKRGFAVNRPPMERAFKGDGMQGRWWNNPRLIEELKLTDEQRKSFDGILQQQREKLIDLRANLEKAEIGMAPLMGEDQPNETKILAQIDKVAQARAELEKANARFLLALRAKLTPAQWKQMQALRQNRHDLPGAPPPAPPMGDPGHMHQ